VNRRRQKEAQRSNAKYQFSLSERYQLQVGYHIKNTQKKVSTSRKRILIGC
jgi:hypothetical protein